MNRRSSEATSFFAALRAPSMAKPSGQGPQPLRLDSNQPYPKKKSFTRALKRAQLHGQTWRGGRLLTASMLGVTPLPPTTTPSATASPLVRTTRLQQRSGRTGSLAGIPAESSNFLPFCQHCWRNGEKGGIVVKTPVTWDLRAFCIQSLSPKQTPDKKFTA